MADVDHYFLAMKSNTDVDLIKTVRYLKPSVYTAISAKDKSTLYLADFGTVPPLMADASHTDNFSAIGDKMYWRMTNTGSSVISDASVSGPSLALTKRTKADGSTGVTTTTVTFTQATPCLYVGSSSGMSDSAVSNPYIKMAMGSLTISSIVQLIGSDGLTVSSDASKNITIGGKPTNSEYSDKVTLQNVKIRNLASENLSCTSGTTSGVTLTNNKNGSFTLNGTATADITLYPMTFRENTIVGHQYYFAGSPSGSSYPSGYQLRTHTVSGGNIAGGVSNIVTFSSASSTGIAIDIKSGTVISNATFWPIFIDLTDAFGSGNEPTRSYMDNLLNLIFPYSNGWFSGTETILPDIENGQIVLDSRVYTGIYASTNTNFNRIFYFAKVVPFEYESIWHIRYRITAEVPTDTNYRGLFYVDFYGSRSDCVTYACWNSHYSNNYRTLGHHVLVFAKDATNASQYGHQLAINLADTQNNTSSSFARNFKVDILQKDNCVVTMYDPMVLFQNLRGYSSTSSSNAFINNTGDPDYNADGINNGLRESGDDNDLSTIYDYQYKAVGATQVRGNSILGVGADGKLVNVISANAKGWFDMTKPLFWITSTKAANWTGTWALCYVISPAAPLTVEDSGSLITLSVGDELYAQCSISSTSPNLLMATGTCVTGTTLQAMTANDGYVYIFIGTSVNNYATTVTKNIDFQESHPVYYYSASKGAVVRYNPVSSEDVSSAGTLSNSTTGNAETSTYPFGFNGRATDQTWGNQNGTFVTNWDVGGANISFRNNSGQLNEIIDGYYYQNEGRYQVLDTGTTQTITSTKTFNPPQYFNSATYFATSDTNKGAPINITGGLTNYREGMRIHPTGNWSDILLCGADNTGDSGTSANSWFVGNNSGSFYISRNGSSSSASSGLSCVSNAWNIFGSGNTLSLNGKEAFNMGDAWLRINQTGAFTSGVYFGSSIVRTDGTLQAGGSGSYFNANSSAITAGVNIVPSATDAKNIGTSASLEFLNSYIKNGYFSSILDVGSSGSYLGVSSSDVSTTLPIKSSFASNTWINGVTNACLTANYTNYGAIFNAAVKDGRISVSTNPASNDNVYLGYATTAQITAGTNGFNNEIHWDAANNILNLGRANFADAGTAPFTVNNSTVVTNLNADKVDGYNMDQNVLTTSSPTFVKATLTQATGTAPLTVSSTTVVTNLNADYIDGKHISVQTSAPTTFASDTIYLVQNDYTTMDLEEAQTVTGAKTFSSAPTFSATTPFNVSNTTIVTNLNADLLDGYHAGNSSGNIAVANGTVVTNLNADMVDGYNMNQNVLTTSSPTFVKATLTQATGTAPLTVSSTTLVSNLNSDMVDGYHAGNNNGQVAVANGTVVTNLNADMVDGHHLDQDVTTTSSPHFSSVTLGSVSGSIAPFVVMNTNKVTKLNADLLDDYHAGHISGTIAIADGARVSSLNADCVDGHHLDQDVTTTSSPTFLAPSITSYMSFQNTANGITFNSGNYITNIKCGTATIPSSGSIATTVGAEGSITLSLPSHGNGLWRVVAIPAPYGDNFGVAVTDNSSTGATVWVKRLYSSSNTTLVIEYIAVKQY